MSKLIAQAMVIVTTVIMMVFFIYSEDLPAQAEALSAIAVLAIGRSLVLERIWPCDLLWNKNRGDLKGDVASLGLIFVALDGLLKYLMPILAVALFGGLTASLNGLPASLPLWAEIIVVTLLIELAAYLITKYTDGSPQQ